MQKKTTLPCCWHHTQKKLAFDIRNYLGSENLIGNHLQLFNFTLYACIVFLNSNIEIGKYILLLYPSSSNRLCSDYAWLFTYFCFSLFSWSICSDISAMASWCFFFKLEGKVHVSNKNPRTKRSGLNRTDMLWMWMLWTWEWWTPAGCWSPPSPSAFS